MPDRKNFDSLLWAIVTVFQVGSAPHSFVSSCICIAFSLLLIINLSILICFFTDSDSGGLEHGAVQRHGVHVAVRRPVLRGSHDVWELRALQFAGRHLG